MTIGPTGGPGNAPAHEVMPICATTDNLAE